MYEGCSKMSASGLITLFWGTTGTNAMHILNSLNFASAQKDLF